MKTTNINILRSFYSVVDRRQQLNRELFNQLLKDWDLIGVNLKEEEMRIENKLSNLTKSRREAVKQFIILENILTEKEKQESNKKALTQTLNSNEQISSEPLIIGNSF